MELRPLAGDRLSRRAASRWLALYARRFDTVEVNATFYRLPTRETVARWIDRTPEGFLFAVKGSRYLTHLKRLRDLGPGLERFLDRIQPLVESPKLGPLLWQLPGNFHRDDDRLRTALERLPPLQHAFEFRHPSWFADDVYELLRHHGVGLVIGDSPQRPFQTHELTAEWTFVRFHHGARGRRGTTRTASSRSGRGASVGGGWTAPSSTSTTTGRASPSGTRKGCASCSVPSRVPDGAGGGKGYAGLMAVERDAILKALEQVIDPELKRPVTDLDMVRDVVVSSDGAVDVTIALTVAGCPLRSSFQDQVAEHVGAVPGVTGVSLRFDVMSPEEKAALASRLRGGRPEREIRLDPKTRVVAVASGKGGVGKSTLSANLAAALAELGESVGVLDADVYGYSIPHVLGVTQRPVVVDSMIVPPVRGDLKVMSIGLFAEDNGPIMWRGPMLHKALEQFLSDVHWGELDTLVVDMPPGTGDVAISIGQLLPRAEAVIVTTPQPAAQQVAVRAAVMAQKTGMRVLGSSRTCRGSSGPARSCSARVAATLSRTRSTRRSCADPVRPSAPRGLRRRTTGAGGGSDGRGEHDDSRPRRGDPGPQGGGIRKALTVL